MVSTDPTTIDLLTKEGAVGCQSHHSIQELRGELLFLSEAGLYGVNTSGGLREVSGQIKSLFNTVDRLRARPNLSKKRAVSFNWTDQNLYIIQVPTEENDDGGELDTPSDFDVKCTTSDSVLVAYDYYRDAWLQWTNLDYTGGVSLYNNKIFFNNRFKNASDVISTELSSMSTEETTHDYNDHASAISFEYDTNWESLQEPTVPKKFLRLKVYSNDTDNTFESPGFQLGIALQKNYSSADTKDESGTTITRCMSRHAKLYIINEKKKNEVLSEYNVPYGANVFIKEGEIIESGKILFRWDPYTDIILASQAGKVKLKDFIEGETYQVEAVEGGKKQMVIIESRDRNLSPHIEITNDDDEIMTGGTILPVKATMVITDGQKVNRGQTLVKIQKDIGKTRDITGGLPRVAELFEARIPKNPSVVSEINGTVKFGDTKRGIRKIIVENSDGESRSYNIPYGKHVIVHDGDFITAGTPLCEGATSPSDILKIMGPGAVREYLVNGIQEVYRLQGVSINDKHIEVIVRQMMKKLVVSDAGDTRLLESERLDKWDFFKENDHISHCVVVTDAGDSELEEGVVIEKSEFNEINSELKENDKKPAKHRKSKPAKFEHLLMGITRASLNTESFLSAASFQETTRVLTDAASSCKIDHLRGLKENVTIGRLIPAGTGFPDNLDIMVGNSSELVPAKADEEKSSNKIVKESV